LGFLSQKSVAAANEFGIFSQSQQPQPIILGFCRKCHTPTPRSGAVACLTLSFARAPWATTSLTTSLNTSLPSARTAREGEVAETGWYTAMGVTYLWVSPPRAHAWNAMPWVTSHKTAPLLVDPELLTEDSGACATALHATVCTAATLSLAVLHGQSALSAESSVTHLRMTCKHTVAAASNMLIIVSPYFFSPVIRQFQQLSDGMMFWLEKKYYCLFRAAQTAVSWKTDLHHQFQRPVWDI
jgi:hypothetical protein